MPPVFDWLLFLWSMYEVPPFEEALVGIVVMLLDEEEAEGGEKGYKEGAATAMTPADGGLIRPGGVNVTAEGSNCIGG